MSTQGPNSPSSAVDDATVGTLSWTSPGSATASDDTRASVAIANSALASHYIKCAGFGFSIPSGATINGITVEIERQGSVANRAVDNSVKIVKADGTFGSTEKADTATRWPTADAYATYGGASDLWGETWTDADINDSDFGVGVSAGNATLNAVTARVDHVRITIDYTAAGTSAQMVSWIQCDL